MSDNAGARLHGIQAGIAPGSRIGGYVVEQQAGAGGMATVYRARESRAIATVDEEHVLPVYAAGEADGVHDARWPQVSAGALYSSDGSVVTTFSDSGTTNSFWEWGSV